MNRQHNIAIFIALFGLVFSVVPALAVNDVYSDRTLKIANKLNCPICHGETVAASQSRLAGEMRDTIQAQVNAGQTDQEIIDFFVARFGEEVLAEPPHRGLNLALWWIPVVVLGLGALVVILYMRDSTGLRRRLTSDESDLDAELEAIAREALGQDSMPNDTLATDSRSD